MKAWPTFHRVLLVILFVCVAGVPVLSAAPESVSGQLLVKYQAGASAAVRAAATREIGIVVLKEYPRFDMQLVQLPAGMTLNQGIAAYGNTPGVQFAEPNYLYRVNAIPNDPMFASLWGMEKIEAQEAWNLTTGAKEVVVADIDTGVDYTHPDLKANMWINTGEIPDNDEDDDNNGYVDDVYGINAIKDSGDPMDDEGHGTHTSGTIGAVGNNGEGVAGVNWTVRIMALKFLDDEGVGATSDAIKCFDYILLMKSRGVNIRVTNNSWGSWGPSLALQTAIDACGNANILNVCAAGNDGVDNDSSTRASYPASFDSPSILSVAASDWNDGAAWFSNWGARTVDIAAPGTSILSTYPDNRYFFFSGTSMACPHVAGAAALIAAFDPTLTGAAIKAQIMNTGDPVSWPGKSTVSNKRLNLKRCLRPFKVTYLLPKQNTVLYVTHPTMIAVVEGFSPSTLAVSLDGSPLDEVSFNPATGELTCPLGPLTPERSYQLTVSGKDVYGGDAAASVTFWVRAKTLYPGKSMISIPAFGVGSVPDVFAEITYPRVAVWNPATMEYEQYPQSFADLTNEAWAATDVITLEKKAPAGRGFWVDLPSTNRLQLHGDVVRSDHSFSMPVVHGFNMIGDPYPYPIGFGSIMIQYNGRLYSLPDAVQAGLIEPVLYRWEGNGYKFSLLPEAVLQPWVGYWILCRANTKLRPMTLIFQPAEAGTPRAADTAPTRAQGNVWELPVNVVDRDTNQKATVILGAQENATNQTDFGLDIAAPPMAPGGLSLTSRSGLLNEALLRDYRPLVDGTDYRWEVTISGTPGAQVVVNWPKLTGLPRNYVLTLHDQVTGEDRYMRTSANYTVTLGPQERERQLVITATPGDIGSLRVVNLQGQRLRANGGAAITCQITRASNVTMEIRTLSGRLVRRFPVTAYAQGLVSVNWDGADNRGRRMPRGAYLCHVLAETSNGQKATAVTTLPF